MFSLLLPEELINLSISQKDKEDILNCLLTVLKNEPIYSRQIVWCFGKTFDEKDIETLLFNISQLKRCDKETFQQILFVIDIINNERINNLVTEISLLANK